MLVSICVPVYNGEDTIKETIESILNQSYDNIEIIVVDNCSTDNTVKVVQEIKTDNLYLYQNESNLGMVGNWNKCMEYVKGEYVQIVCADDIITPDCIEKKMKIVHNNADVNMVFSASVIIDENDNTLMTRHQYNRDCVLDGKKLAKQSFYTKNLYGEPSNVLFKTNIIQNVGKFAMNTCYATDWDMWLRISCTGKVGYVNEELMKYRISTSNETSKIKFKKFLADDKIMVQNLIDCECMKITALDKCIHRIMYILRMFARYFYMKIKA